MQDATFKLLIVDDDAHHREMWSLLLSDEGYRVETAADGGEALRLADDNSLDLVLLDVNMPGIDGFEVLSEIRASASANDLPVILLTANGASADVVRGFDLGANDYVSKPCDPEVLSARIHNQLRQRPQQHPGAIYRLPEGELDVRPGSVLGNRYRIERLIGRGGTGAVFRATHLGHGGEVAVKFLRQESSGERLRREGVSICRLGHPGTAKVLDYLVTAAGVPCLVMELLDGHSLADELDRQGPLTPHRVAEILVPICDVLTVAHGRGIFHRDVKPHNVFLHREDGREVVKVLDFGIAKVLDDPDGTLTIDGGLLGTPAYLAPERWLTNVPIDGRSDVYSLGVMLYELLTGRRPFSSENLHALIRMHLMEKPVPPAALRPDLPPEIEAVVLSALEKKAESRPMAAELARDFTTALADVRDHLSS